MLVFKSKKLEAQSDTCMDSCMAYIQVSRLCAVKTSDTKGTMCIGPFWKRAQSLDKPMET